MIVADREDGAPWPDDRQGEVVGVGGGQLGDVLGGLAVVVRADVGDDAVEELQDGVHALRLSTPTLSTPTPWVDIMEHVPRIEDAQPRINPSILAADFVNMQSELARIPGADFVHVDVMDNHFVPNLTFGPQMVERVQATSPVPLDVHLMITDPARWAPGYAELGAASVTFHLEAATEPVALARRLRDIGARAGVAVKPGTPVEGLFPVLDEFDQILVMTVEPGFGGQSFMPETMPKLRMLADEARRRGSAVWLQVDGGIGESTIAQAAEAGADTFVAGSAVFGAENPDAAIAALRSTAARHSH